LTFDYGNGSVKIKRRIQMKTIFIVCIEEIDTNDFLFACSTREIAEEKAAKYEKDYDAKNSDWNCVVYEEKLY